MHPPRVAVLTPDMFVVFPMSCFLWHDKCVLTWDNGIPCRVSRVMVPVSCDWCRESGNMTVVSCHRAHLSARCHRVFLCVGVYVYVFVSICFCDGRHLPAISTSDGVIGDYRLTGVAIHKRTNYALVIG